MSRTPSPVDEATGALQVANVLRYVRGRVTGSGYHRGRRFGPDGGRCLVGAIDEAAAWTVVGVRDEATLELARRLPTGMRLLARLDARVALMIYNDAPGGRARVARLVDETLEALGVAPVEPRTIILDETPVRRVKSAPTDRQAIVRQRTADRATW